MDFLDRMPGPIKVCLWVFAYVGATFSLFLAHDWYFFRPHSRRFLQGRSSAGDSAGIDLTEIKKLEPQMCNVVCRTTLNLIDAKEFKVKTDAEYRVNMLLDNIPLVMPYDRSNNMDSLVYQQGFLVGMEMQYGGKKEHKDFINNHLTFTIKYHKDEETDAARIVGFEVKPLNVKHEYPLEVEDGKEIVFTYDVEFQESEIKSASRWDNYVYTVESGNHWFSEETGWIIVRGDVFRPPTNSDLLCVFVGTAIQCFGLILVTMVFAALGFLSPSNRKGSTTTLVFVLVFMGSFAGYISGGLYKMFGNNMEENFS